MSSCKVKVSEGPKVDSQYMEEEDADPITPKNEDTAIESVKNVVGDLESKGVVNGVFSNFSFP